MKSSDVFFKDFHLFFADPDIAVGIVYIPELLKQHVVAPIGFPDTFSSPHRFDQKDFHRPWFTQVEIDKLNGFKNLKRQVQWMGGRFAVKQLVLQLIDPKQTVQFLEVHHEPMGAPFLTSFPHFSISIAHSGVFAMAAMGLKNDCRVGVDIEACRSFDVKGVIETVFSPREQSMLEAGLLSEFYRSWTLKEAFLKLLRKGFSEDVRWVEIWGDCISYKSREMDQVRIHSRPIGSEYIFSLVHTCATIGGWPLDGVGLTLDAGNIA
jgi:4'-phosphopantetheinyl transferase